MKKKDPGATSTHDRAVFENASGVLLSLVMMECRSSQVFVRMGTSISLTSICGAAVLGEGYMCVGMLHASIAFDDDLPALAAARIHW